MLQRVDERRRVVTGTEKDANQIHTSFDLTVPFHLKIKIAGEARTLVLALR